MMWRREWDSNPRYAFTYTRVPGVRLKPLGHLSWLPIADNPAAISIGFRRFCKPSPIGGCGPPPTLRSVRPGVRKRRRPLLSARPPATPPCAATATLAARCPTHRPRHLSTVRCSVKHGENCRFVRLELNVRRTAAGLRLRPARAAAAAGGAGCHRIAVCQSRSAWECRG